LSHKDVGARGGVDCFTSRRVAGSMPDVVTGIFIYIIRPHYGPGVDSASNRNGYQGIS